jgi:hypothetical protein
MKRRTIAVLAATALLVATAAVPALAAKPDTDAKGCENTKAGQLDSYCSNDDA